MRGLQWPRMKPIPEMALAVLPVISSVFLFSLLSLSLSLFRSVLIPADTISRKICKVFGSADELRRGKDISVIH